MPGAGGNLCCGGAPDQVLRRTAFPQIATVWSRHGRQARPRTCDIHDRGRRRARRRQWGNVAEDRFDGLVATNLLSPDARGVTWQAIDQNGGAWMS